MTTELTSSRKKHLRKLARDKKAAAQIGKNGLTDAFIDKFRTLLDSEELLKLRILDSCPIDSGELSEKICKASGAELVAELGSTVIFYKANAKLPPAKRIRFDSD